MKLITISLGVLLILSASLVSIYYISDYIDKKNNIETIGILLEIEKCHSNKTECPNQERYIESGGYIIETGQKNMGCSVNSTHICCDDGLGHDGNGDGVYQSGETWECIPLDTTERGLG